MVVSVFQTFVREIAHDWRQRYPFASRLSVAMNDARFSKASSFYLGTSPRCGKHFILNFQHAPKPWQVGEFTANVNISTGSLKSTESRHFGIEEFKRFEDGYYRLGSAAGVVDTWWCLRQKEGGVRESSLVKYWEPTSYDFQSNVIAECANEVSLFVERFLFMPAGFVTASVATSRVRL